MKKEPDEIVRPHTFDGIQEYDKKLPNWWLWTLWLSVVFAVGYWFWAHRIQLRPTQELKYQEQYFAAFPDAAKAQEEAVPSDKELWMLSQEAGAVTAGARIFQTTCASCHGADLKGAIGPNLTDTTWLHGGNPAGIYTTVTKGVLAKGMPNWGPQLGKKRVLEVVSFVLSHHKEGEEVIDGSVKP